MNTSENVKRWRRNTKKKLVAGLGGCCFICGYDRCNNALELHHKDPNQKELSFGKITANPCKWDKIVAEAKKCVLLCSNCHKEVHAGVTELPEPTPEFIEPDDPVYKKDMFNECPICGDDKPIARITCSRSCGAKVRYNVDWDDTELARRVSQGDSWRSMGRFFGVSDNAVRKRAKKLNLI